MASAVCSSEGGARVQREGGRALVASCSTPGEASSEEAGGTPRGTATLGALKGCHCSVVTEFHSLWGSRTQGSHIFFSEVLILCSF